ncbi:hypothetical protein B296_00047160 [Ensete ventricosum]|uniref:Uncharacterized protein n=1 Tax=Ensete ventricosum TaxID=4639 RepID=A0A426Z0V1_ENSVE|nr:hypothetical protein B296_00047160 [Ensete ventricosum]
MEKETTGKISFTLSSASSRPNPSAVQVPSQPFPYRGAVTAATGGDPGDEGEDGVAKPQFISVFDASQSLAASHDTRSVIIPPVPDAKTKCPLPVPAPDDDYMRWKFREDMKDLPQDRGLDEFKDIRVEDFPFAYLAGYGWSEGQVIGRNKMLAVPKVRSFTLLSLDVEVEQSNFICTETEHAGDSLQFRHKQMFSVLLTRFEILHVELVYTMWLSLFPLPGQHSSIDNPVVDTRHDIEERLSALGFLHIHGLEHESRKECEFMAAAFPRVSVLGLLNLPDRLNQPTLPHPRPALVSSYYAADHPRIRFPQRVQSRRSPPSSSIKKGD